MEGGVVIRDPDKVKQKAGVDHRVTSGGTVRHSIAPYPLRNMPSLKVFRVDTFIVLLRLKQTPMRLLSLQKYTGFLLILLLSACAEQEKPVTKEEALQLAKSIEGSMSRQSGAKFNEAFDGEALVERMKKEATFKISAVMAREAANGLKSGKMGTELVRSMGKDGSYELVKQYEKDKKQHLVFRLFGTDGKLNYHDLELVKKKEKVRIADMYVYLAGENLSSTLAQTFSMLDDNYDNMSKEDREKIGNMKRIRKLLNEGKHQEADQLYQQFPEVLKKQKMMQVVRIEIASELGDDVYSQAMDDFERAYPDAPNLYLMKIDAYILRKDFDGAMNAVNKLDSLIDKDTFLDYYRGLICKLKEDKEGQDIYFTRLVKNKPDFGPGVLELVAFHMDNNQTDKGVLVAQQYKASSKASQEQFDVLYQLYPELQKKLE